MKKIIIIHVCTCIFAAFLIQKASCQPINNQMALNLRAAEPQKASLAPLTPDKDYINNISTKALRGFLRNYKNSKNVSWRKVSDGGYIAEFTMDSIQTKVAYNSNGSWTYTLKKYAEGQMSSELRSMIKRIYFDYAISEVTEIELPQRENIIYRVLIKFADKFKILQICDNEIAVAGDYINP